MISKSVKMNSKDISAYVHKAGISIAYKYRKGLPDKYTMNNVKHVDLGESKRIVTLRLNSTSEEITDMIISEYRSGLIFLTIGSDTFLAEPIAEARKEPAITIAGEVTEYQISPLVFEEL
jgi:lambda repressor-like predicted transcriptional regulator